MIETMFLPPKGLDHFFKPSLRVTGRKVKRIIPVLRMLDVPRARRRTTTLFCVRFIRFSEEGGRCASETTKRF